jgi:predicted MPP superfamily phosphohydrolase
MISRVSSEILGKESLSTYGGPMEIIITLFICFFIAISLLVVYMYKEAFADRVVYHELTFSTFPKSFGKVNLFFISDIHRRHISESMIEQVKGKVDVVIIGGDLAEKGVPLERVKENILKLKKLGPVLFVWGNNDYELDVPLLDALLLNLDVKVLVNSSILFESEESDRLYFLGVDDLSTAREDLDAALSETDKSSFKILVSHNPGIERRIRPEHGISLILSGHTHGGQIRLLGFSLYEKGKLHKDQQRAILISNGYGTTRLPLRLGAKAETHLLTIGHQP